MAPIPNECSKLITKAEVNPLSTLQVVLRAEKKKRKKNDKDDEERESINLEIPYNPVIDHPPYEVTSTTPSSTELSILIHLTSDPTKSQGKEKRKAYTCKRPYLVFANDPLPIVSPLIQSSPLTPHVLLPHSQNYL
jgi:hypothetical protein